MSKMPRCVELCPISIIGLSIFTILSLTAPTYADTEKTKVPPNSNSISNGLPLESLQAQMPPPEVRSLEVQKIKGTVTVNGRPARLGDRLVRPGDEIETGSDSKVKLRINDYIGSIELSENTKVRLQILSGASVNNQVTEVFVDRGQVRLAIASSVARQFRGDGELQTEEQIVAALNPLLELAQDSEDLEEQPEEEEEEEELEQDNTTSDAPVRVRTPRGVAGVRGTAFGVNVGPNGKTGVQTIEGAVGVGGRNREVAANTGANAVINPGSIPIVNPTTPRLATMRLRSIFRSNSRTTRFLGQVEPMDLVFINDVPIETDADGKFDVTLPMPPSGRFRFVVRGPSVRERVYVISVL